MKKRGKKEAIVFCPIEQWYFVLDEIFNRHNGLKDGRKIFSLNLEKFIKFKSEIEQNNEVRIEICYENVIPTWCTWPYRVESQALAKAIGFDQQEDVRAYIWVEEACGKL